MPSFSAASPRPPSPRRRRRPTTPPPSASTASSTPRTPIPSAGGAWQIQTNAAVAGATRAWDDDGKPADRARYRERAAEVVVTYGVVDALDLAIAVGYAGLADGAEDRRYGHGFADIALSAKWRLCEFTHHRLAFGCVPTLVIPAGDDGSSTCLGPSQDYWSASTCFVAVTDWTDAWSTNVDVGFEIPFGEDRETARGCFGTDVALGWQPLPCLQPEVELNYHHEFYQGEPGSDLLAVTAGLVLPLSDLLCVRAGVQQGVAGRNADRTTTGLLSVDWNF